MSDLLKIEFIDDSFTVDKSEEYQLLIHEGSVGYQMAIFTQENQLLLFLSWQKNVSEERVNHLLSLTYQSKKIALKNNNITLIPSSLYSPSQHIYYLNMLGLNKETHTLLVDHTANLTSNSIYAITNDELAALNKNFPDFTTFAKNTTILSALQQLTQDTASYLAINFDHDYTDFTYFNKGELNYHHTQFCQNADEFNYFLLAVAKEFQLDFSTIPILISGIADESHPYYERLRKYSKQLRFLELSALFTCNNYTALKKASYSLPLLGLLCAS